MNPRVPPYDKDWARRWLRRRRIPCEGDQLQAALDSLDGPTWQRLKAAWRKREERLYGGSQYLVSGALNKGKRLGAVWLRLIAWGVITEDEARLLAGTATSHGTTFYSDAGATFVLSFALGQMVDALRNAPKAAQKERDAAASYLRVLVRQDGNLDTLDERVVTALTTGGAPYDAETVRRALASLKESGDYDRIIREARGE
jgi:hypothetical protein